MEKWRDARRKRLRLLDPRGCIAELWDGLEECILALRQIDTTLRVSAAEYVPAIQDAFAIIDRILPPTPCICGHALRLHTAAGCGACRCDRTFGLPHALEMPSDNPPKPR